MEQVTDHFILQGQEPVPARNMAEWGGWYMQRTPESIKVSRSKVGDVEVLTDFLGFAHGWNSRGRPLLFETMVFGGKLHLKMQRYATWRQAEAGHRAMIERVQKTEGYLS